MLNKFLQLLFFSFFSFTALAQSPGLRVIRINSENYCLGNELSIDVDITGTYPADNKFTVVAYRNWNDPKSRWEYPAELRGDKLITILKEPVLANSSTFAIRILASNPQQEIDAGESRRIFTKSSVHLTSRWGLTADTINSTEKIALTLLTNPPTRGTAVLTSGDTLNFWDVAGNFTLPKTREGTYHIKEASNVCGPMSTSGQVNIKVNAVDFMPTSFSPKTPCEGGEIKVLFNTAGSEFNKNTKFKIRFAYDNVRWDSYKYIDAPAVLTGQNELTARVPENLIQSTASQNLYLGIVAENPTAISINKSLKMYPYPKPSFSLTPDKYSINIGEKTYVYANPKGMPPFKITLTNGDILQNGKEYTLQKTTQFQVKTFESGCGVITDPANNPVTVQIRPSLAFNLPSNSTELAVYCEGQTARIPFLASGVNSQTSFTLEVFTGSSKKIYIPARLNGDYIEFVVPGSSGDAGDLDYNQGVSIRAIASNPSITSYIQNVKFQGPPKMVKNPNSVYSVATPSVIQASYYILGGGPFELEMKDGSKLTQDYSYYTRKQFLRNDTTFQLARISNACFTNDNPPVFSLLVADPNSSEPSLFVNVNNTNLCTGDSVEVEVFVHGKFEAGNEFTLSNTGYQQVTLNLDPDFSKSKTFKFKYPLEYNDQSVQLTSTLPRLVSETPRITFTSPPQTPVISETGKKENPITKYLGYYPYANTSVSKFSNVVYTMNGIETNAKSDHNGSLGVPLSLENGKITEFKIKSVENTCGKWVGEVASYYYGVGYKLILNRDIYPIWNCAGSDAEVRFSIENGQAEPGTKFTLQISATGSADSYSDIASVTDGSFIRFTTPDLKEGSYYLRLRSSDNIYSETSDIRIGRAPTAKIVTGYPGDSIATINYGTQAPIRTILTGNEPFGIMYSDGHIQSTNSNQSSYYPVVTDPQTFTISKVWNSCGFGTTSGHVQVITKPILELSKFPVNLDPTFCPGQKVELNYEVKGATLSSNEYVSFYLRNSAWDIIKLDSVSRNSGKIQLTIPANLPGEYFSIIAKVTAFKIEKAVGYQLYATPDMTLGGDNTITAGETSTLLVRANSNFAINSIFELSDGTSFKVTAPFPGGITEVKVTPTSTTTYTLKTAQTVCGVSKVSGSATLTVLPKLAQWLSFERIEGLRRESICNSDTVSIRFYHFGNSGGEQAYEVQLSDSTGNNFTTIPTFSNQYSYLNAVIPAGIKGADSYRIRIISKDPKVSGGTYANRLKISEPASARVVTPSVYYQPGQPVEAVIKLEGSSPFSYNFGDNNFSQNRYTRLFSDTIRLTPTRPMAVYKILRLSNECGVGKINDPSSFTVELITGIETLTERIKFGPNPTRNTLLVQFENHESRNIEIFDLTGRKIFAGKYTGKEAQIDLIPYPTGIYLLKVRKRQAEITYRVMKY